MGAKLQGKARERIPLAADFVSILTAGNFTLKEEAKKEIATAIDADNKKLDNGRDPKAQGKCRKGAKNGQPRRDFTRFDATRAAGPPRLPEADQASRSDDFPRRKEANPHRQISRTPQNNRRNYGTRFNQQYRRAATPKTPASTTAQIAPLYTSPCDKFLPIPTPFFPFLRLSFGGVSGISKFSHPHPSPFSKMRIVLLPPFAFRRAPTSGEKRGSGGTLVHRKAFPLWNNTVATVLNDRTHRNRRTAPLTATMLGTLTQ